MTIKYLLILGIGHLLGDFYFQNQKITKYKDDKYKGVLLHSLKYYIAFLLSIIPIFSTDMFLAATYATLIHFIIDTIKHILLVKKRIRKSGNVFMACQCTYIFNIFLLSYIMNYWHFSIGHINIMHDILSAFNCDAEILARWILALLFIHIPTNVFIQNFLEEFKPKWEETIIKADSRAGRKIGTIERLIMLIFLSTEQYAAIGLVLTAKSIARYDKITKNETFAEYYLLGTLLSTLCVVICRMLILT